MKTIRQKAALVAAGMAACLQGLPACAADAEVYGVVGTYLGSVKHSGDSQAVTQLNGGGLTTSFLGFKGDQNLGDGTRVIWSLESFFRPDTGEQGRNGADPLFSRNAWVGIEGRYGRLTLGRQTNPTYAAMSQLSPFGSSVVFSPLTLHSFVAAYGSNIIGDTVWNNVIEYATPSLDGLRGTAVYGLGEQAGHAAIANLGLHGTYNRGNFMAAISGQRLRMNISTPLVVEQNAWLAGARYDFGLFKVYGNAERASIAGGNASKLLDAGLAVPVGGAGTIMAEAARSNIDTPRVATLRRTTASVGYDRRLSKRTDAYAIYVGDKKSTAAWAGTTAIGVRHVF